MFNKRESKNIRNVDLINMNKILKSTIILWPVMTLVYLSKGLSFFEIGILNSTGSLIIFLLEVPSGVIADKFGRKKNLLLGNFLNILFVVILYFSESFLGLILSEVIFSISSCLISGTDTSLLYDSLQHEKREKEYGTILAKNNGVTLAISLFTSIVATMLFSKHPIIIFLWTAIIYSVMFFVSVFLSEVKVVQEPKKIDVKLSNESVLYKTIKKYKIFIILSLFSSVIILLVSNISVLTSPILIENGMDLKYTGYVLAGSKVISIILLRNQKVILAHIKKNVFITFTAILGMSLILLYFINSQYYWIYTICVVASANDFLQPIVSEKINEHIQSKNRTTMLSVTSMFDNILFFIGDPIVGFGIDKVGYNRSFGTFGLLLFLIFPVYLKNKKVKT